MFEAQPFYHLQIKNKFWRQAQEPFLTIFQTTAHLLFKHIFLKKQIKKIIFFFFLHFYCLNKVNYTNFLDKCGKYKI